MSDPKASPLENPEMRTEFLKSMLRIAAIGALTGGGIRAGVEALRQSNPEYTPPKPANPVVVDMPYYVDTPAAIAAKKNKLMKFAEEDDPTYFPKWMGSVGRALESWLPTFRSPFGNPDATKPSDIPLYYAAIPPLAMGGAGAGYLATDKILRAASRRRAEEELEDAKDAYNRTILKRITQAHTPLSKSSADARERTVASLEKTYGMVKEAISKEADNRSGEDAWQKIIESGLFPGLGSGSPTLAAMNALLVGGAGTLGGYAGYNYARDKEQASYVRNKLKQMDQEAASKMPAPLIARLVPVKRTISV